MAWQLSVTFGNRRVAGIAGLILLVLFFVLPALLAASLDVPTAEQWIRGYLKNQAAISRLGEFPRQSHVDYQLATQLQEELAFLETMTFEGTRARHLLVAPPGTSRRIYVVRTQVPDREGSLQTRYFSLSAENNLFDFFWVNEQSAWIWWFAF